MIGFISVCLFVFIGGATVYCIVQACKGRFLKAGAIFAASFVIFIIGCVALPETPERAAQREAREAQRAQAAAAEAREQSERVARRDARKRPNESCELWILEQRDHPELAQYWAVVQQARSLLASGETTSSERAQLERGIDKFERQLASLRYDGFCR